MAQSVTSRHSSSPFHPHTQRSGSGEAPRRAQQTLAMLRQKQLNIEFKLDDTPYKPVNNLGTGAYGVVCSAIDTRNDRKVAIKKIPKAFGALTLIKRTLREVQILRHFRHENIVAVLDMFQADGTYGNDVYMVMDLMETDLHQIIHSRQALSEQHLQYFMYQILRGLKYIHSAGVIHRDLKPSNLLVNADCLLKIGDFGMARSVGQAAERSGPMTQYVATRWYRAPELVFSMLDYTTLVDIWSVGCIFAELIMRRQLFPGKDHVSQLKLIVSFLGTPDEEIMGKISSDIVKTLITSMGHCDALPWASILPKASADALDLVAQMMKIAPWQRISSVDALAHVYLEPYHDPDMEPVCAKHVVIETDNIETLQPEELKTALENSALQFSSNPTSPAASTASTTPTAAASTSSAFPFTPQPAPTPAKAEEKAEEPPNVLASRRSSDESDIQMLSAKMSGRLLDEKPGEPEPELIPPATDSGLNSMGSEPETSTGLESSVAKEEKGAEPMVAEPTVAEPTVAEPKVAEPKVAEPTVSEPKVAETRPRVPEPKLAESRVDEPKVTVPPAKPKVEEQKSVEQESEINEDILGAPSSSAQRSVMPAYFPKPRPRTVIQHTDSLLRRRETFNATPGEAPRTVRKRPNSLNEEQASLVRRIFSNALMQSRLSQMESQHTEEAKAKAPPELAVFRAPPRPKSPPSRPPQPRQATPPPAKAPIVKAPEMKMAATAAAAPPAMEEPRVSLEAPNSAMSTESVPAPIPPQPTTEAPTPEEEKPVPVGVQFFKPSLERPSRASVVSGGGVGMRVGGVRVGAPTSVSVPESPRAMETNSSAASSAASSAKPLYAIKAVSADGRQQIFQPTVVEVNLALEDKRARQAEAEVTVLNQTGSGRFQTSLVQPPPMRVTQYRTINAFGIGGGGSEEKGRVLMAGGRPTYGEERKRQVTHHGFGLTEDEFRAQLRSGRPFRTTLSGIKLDESAPRAAASLTVKEPARKPPSTVDPKVLLRNKLVAKKAAVGGPSELVTAHERRLEREGKKKRREEGRKGEAPPAVTTEHDRLLAERWTRMEAQSEHNAIQGEIGDLISESVSSGKAAEGLDSSNLYSTWVEASQMDPEVLQDLEKEIN